jgi:biopolymer transport protein ExbD
MRHIVLGGCVLVACGRGDRRDESEICDVIRRDPQHAAASVAAKLPGDPVRIARTIEDCIAPGGDECERVARIVAVIRTIVPNPPLLGDGDALETCRGAPPELRRCLLPSYALAHGDECQQVRDRLATLPITVTPSSTRAAECEDAGAIAIAVAPGGIWLGVNDATRCFGPRRGTALDRDWLDAELRPVASHGCRPSVEIGGEASVAYQDLITVMDVAVTAGFVDVGLASPGETVVSFAKLDPAAAALHCARGTPKRAARSARPAAPRAPGRDALAAATVIVITKTAISVAGKEIISTADAAVASAPIAVLEQAVRNGKSGTVVVQADEATSAIVIHHVVTTLQRAGHDDVLFAVKNR